MPLSVPLSMKARIQEYLGYLRYERNASPHTLRNYASDLAQFLEFLSKTGRDITGSPEVLAGIGHHEIRASLAMLYEAARKKSSIALKVASLRAFLQYPHRDGIAQDNPPRLHSPPQLP